MHGGLATRLLGGTMCHRVPCVWVGATGEKLECRHTVSIYMSIHVITNGHQGGLAGK